MKFFGLAFENADASGLEPHRRERSPGLPFSVLYGSVSFGVVSMLAYSIWAFQLIRGTAAMYSTITVVYLGLAGLALSRLVVAPGAWRKFPLLFAVAFVAYTVCWCAFWFGLDGRYRADLWGAAAGLAAMAWMFRRAFGAESGFVRLFVVLLVCHSAGYYLGGELCALVRGPAGRLLWGVAHGLGFGAGLGYVLFRCQRRDNG